MVIDVSENNGVLNWDTIKPQIEAAIIRCGYGSDIAGQDDKQWARNVSECERLGIPFGAYLYSYANTPAKIQSEISHAKRLLSGHKPTLPIYYDLEEAKYRGWFKSAAEQWIRAMRSYGYIDGIYAGQEFWNRELGNVNPASVWVPAYGSNKGGRKYEWARPKISKHIDGWQYTSTASVPGIQTYVDVSEFYTDYISGGDEMVTADDVKIMYRDLLDRRPESAAAVNNWVNTKKTFAEVYKAISESAESKAQWAKELYQKYLQRNPSDAEVKSWNGKTRQQIFDGIVNSDEAKKKK